MTDADEEIAYLRAEIQRLTNLVLAQSVEIDQLHYAAMRYREAQEARETAGAAFDKLMRGGSP